MEGPGLATRLLAAVAVLPTTTTTVVPITTTTIGRPGVRTVCDSLRSRQGPAGSDERALIGGLLAAFGC